MSNIEISVCVPLYRCDESLAELYERMVKTLEELVGDSFQIVFVDDCSPAKDWPIIKALTQKDQRVLAIHLSRNFGQHNAITAGLNYCSGDWVIVMDGDLQDQPEFIAKLYVEAKNKEVEVVFARRTIRMDSFLKKMTSKCFYKVFDYFTENKSDSAASNFGIFSKNVITHYINLKEHSRAFPLLIKWLGFKASYVEVDHASRKQGKSSYTYSKLFDFAMDAIISQSNKPLKLSIRIGLVTALFSFISLVWLSVRSFIYAVPMGWTSIMVSIFFVGGLIFVQLGLIGLYVGKIYDETKNRPIFVIQEICGAK
jgi:glycosyltransferase involved in cell wall biosynthesis